MRATVLLLLLPLAAACGDRVSDETAAGEAALADSAFAVLQERGASPAAMGVDQYTSTHRFDDLPDGGRIELQRDGDVAEDVAQIRAHLRGIATAFARGDFSTPGFVHDRAEVPGAAVMREKRAAIRYDFAELPRGGEVRMVSADPEAVDAIHRFLAFQRGDHRAAGHAAH